MSRSVKRSGLDIAVNYSQISIVREREKGRERIKIDKDVHISIYLAMYKTCIYINYEYFIIIIYEYYIILPKLSEKSPLKIFLLPPPSLKSWLFVPILLKQKYILVMAW